MTAAFLREAAASARRFGTSALGEDFNDARHIAVADWLVWEADDTDQFNAHSGQRSHVSRKALAVARAYLGRDS